MKLPKFLQRFSEKYQQRDSGIIVPTADYRELSYANNSKSLFRKYANLVTWFSKTQLGCDYLSDHSFSLPYNPKDISLLLPNGFIEEQGKDYQMTVTTRACYASKLYPALQTIDLVSQWISDFDE